MGSYAYCQHKDCGAGLDTPTIREAVLGQQECRFGHVNPLYHREDALAYALEELADRVTALEAKDLLT